MLYEVITQVSPDDEIKVTINGTPVSVFVFNIESEISVCGRQTCRTTLIGVAEYTKTEQGGDAP